MVLGGIPNPQLQQMQMMQQMPGAAMLAPGLIGVPRFRYGEYDETILTNFSLTYLHTDQEPDDMMVCSGDRRGAGKWGRGWRQG